MAGWDFCNVGFICEKENVENVKKLLECMGIDFDDYQDSVDGVINNKFLDVVDKGCNNSNFKPEEIYTIVNKVFENVSIFYEGEEGNSVSDWYSRFEKIFDPKKKKIYCGEYNYCIGEGEDKEESEWEEEIENTKIKKDKVYEIVNHAKDKGYNELIEKICKSFKLNYVSPVFKQSDNSKTKKKYKPSKDQLKEVKNIERTNEKLKSRPIDDIIVDIEKQVIDNLEVDSVVECKKHTSDVRFYINNNLIGILDFRLRDLIKPTGIQGVGGLLYTWLVFKEHEKGYKYLQYEYRFLDLDYDSIRREILDLIGNEEEIPIIEKYQNGNHDNDYISRQNVLEVHEASRFYMRGFESSILNYAMSLDIDILKYDKNNGYIPDYLNIYEKLLEDIGNKIELENPFYSREESDLDGIEVGMRLNLYTYDSPMGKEASVITPKDKEIYLPPIVSLNIAEPLEKGWIKGVAEVVSIEPVQDNPNKNTVYIKIVLDK